MSVRRWKINNHSPASSNMAPDHKKNKTVSHVKKEISLATSKIIFSVMVLQRHSPLFKDIPTAS